ncbi:hypothetical protein KPH14_006090 [Odynerus spinipes]|uniref:Phosphatidylinositol-glycan biosynthesis class X protein n=1 Tax=Odynerus spinipes TaxID=1348599 RepID=A0AAD9RJQ9_9HYME|nr:hypothetical protein KPH14_006090 [Odynerus spinipes]
MTKLLIARCYLRNFIYIYALFQFFPLSTGIDARVEFYVDGSGFHRNFIYNIKLNNFTEENCHAALYHELPSALYVNINELADLIRVEKIKVCSMGETDVESFMENAKSQNVTVCARLQNNSCIMTLPIHQRYLYPKENGAYEDIILKKPNLLISCKKRIRDYRVSKLDLCPLCASLALKWREIPYTTDDMDYIWTVPVGNTLLLPVVTFVTLLTSIVGTIFLLKTIWNASPKDSQKQD